MLTIPKCSFTSGSPSTGDEHGVDYCVDFGRSREDVAVLDRTSLAIKLAIASYFPSLRWNRAIKRDWRRHRRQLYLLFFFQAKIGSHASKLFVWFGAQWMNDGKGGRTEVCCLLVWQVDQRNRIEVNDSRCLINSLIWWNHENGVSESALVKISFGRPTRLVIMLKGRAYVR